MSLLLLFTNRWLPTQLGSSLKVWLQGNQLTTTPISSWPDASGNGNNAGEAPGNEPDVAAANLNGMNVAQFTGSNTDLLDITSGAVSGFTEGTIFFVAKAASTANMSLPVTRSSGAAFPDQYNNDGLGAIATSNFSSTSKTIPDPGGTTSWHIAAFRSKASDWRMRWNGTEIFTTGTNTFEATTGKVRLGQEYVGSWFTGHLAEVIIVNSFLTTAEAEQIEGYLAHKWGLTSVLPGGHTYKTNPPYVVQSVSMTASPGTFSYTGQSVNLTRSLQMPADAGVFSYSGQSVQLLPGVSMVASQGTFSYTGQSVNLTALRSMPAGQATFSYTGQAANLTLARTMAAGLGTFSYAGQATTLTVSRRMTADPGAFTYTGQSANLLLGRSMVAAPGSFAYSGQDAGLLASYTMVAAPGVFSYAGQDVTLTLGSSSATSIVAGTGVFTYAGQDIAFTITLAPPPDPWQVEDDPPPVIFVPDPDPETAGVIGPYTVAYYDPVYYLTDGPAYGVDDDPGDVDFEPDPDPPPTDDTEGGYHSLFYDPAFYDTTEQTWLLEDDPPLVALLEET